MSKEKKNNYNPTIDALRILAILAVIIIHTTTRTLEIAKYDLIHFQWTFILNQTFRFAVPLFFLISGFVLELNHSFNNSYFMYAKKRLNKILIPYIFWSFIYFFFVYTVWPFKVFSIQFINLLLRGDASYQLYFIPALIIYYLLFPFLHKYFSIFAKKKIVFFLSGVELILLFSDYYSHPLLFYSPLRIALLNFCFFLLGMIASHNNEKMLLIVKKWKIGIFLILAISVYIVTSEAYTRYLNTHNYFTFYSQWRPSVFIYSLSLSSLLYYSIQKIKIPVSLIIKLSKLSFFVFFVHIIVLEILWYKIFIHVFHVNNDRLAREFWYDPLYFLTVTILSFGIAFLAHKIPKLSILTG